MTSEKAFITNVTNFYSFKQLIKEACKRRHNYSIRLSKRGPKNNKKNPNYQE